jgi:phenylpyruvate tautomerase PptA (4-oxalocrotonate tautomerase family)
LIGSSKVAKAVKEEALGAMVRVEINMVEGDHSQSEKIQFMKKATEVIAEVLKCPANEVRVTILEYKRENASKAGISFLESG